MSLKMRIGVIVLGLFLGAQLSVAEVIGGEDFDGGTTNGGFTAMSQVLLPDNTANNGRFPGPGSFFDRFGIATNDIAGDGVDPDGDGNANNDLPNFVIDSSAGLFPADRAGIIPESKVDNQFVITDLQNNDNTTSPNAAASWTFDITDASNLSVSIDLAQIGDFGTDGGGQTDSFAFSYSIDGGASQNLFDITSTNDDRGAVVTLANGSQFLTLGGNFFFDAADFDLLGCVAGVDNSCTPVDVFGNGSLLLFPDALDANQDGRIYEDTVNGDITDTPINLGDLDEGAVRTYGETNGFGTFSNPEFNLSINPLMVNGDDSNLITNQLTAFVGAVTGTGSSLTLSLNAEQYGGDEWFVFDNIVVEGDVGGGGPVCDINGDTVCDTADLRQLYDDIDAGTVGGASDIDGNGTVENDDIGEWLSEAGTFNGKDYRPGDTDLDGSVGGNDFTQLAVSFGDEGLPGAYWDQGNFNGADPDGVFRVGGPDFTGLAVNFGHVSVSAVPEPSGLGILLAGCLCLMSFVRSRR